MSDFPFAIVLFDLDGTLVDSNRDLAPAVNHALQLEGRPAVPRDRVRHMIGGGASGMLAKALEWSGGMVEQKRFAELTDALLEHYLAHIADNTVPFDGCLAALDALKARGCRLGVCTNKLERPARDLLRLLGMSHYFDAIYGSDTLGRGRSKPQPDMLLAAAQDCGGGRFAMVGDSTYDTRAASAANAPSVVLSFGYNDVPLDEIESDVMVDHYDELVPALERLGASVT